MSARERATFDAAELAVVLSHYDLGVIESITDFPRGSRRSPKVGIVAQGGKFLLKRRGVDRAHPDRVRFTHRVQRHLASIGFPTAKLIPARNGGFELLHIKDHVYEVFEFIAGHPYRRSMGETRDAGAVLARFHLGTETFETSERLATPRGDYHDAPGVRTGLYSIGSTLSSHDSFSGDEAELATLVQALLSAYDAAVDAVNAAGYAQWPERIIHSDWHPGNLLFRNDAVVAVIDYDTLRLSRRMIDLANGALQFSIIAQGDPATWPDHLDEERYRAFLAGYQSPAPLTDAERRDIPRLMIEALIAECVPPITETGSMGQWGGFRMLQMIRRKTDWIRANADRLVSVSLEPGA